MGAVLAGGTGAVAGAAIDRLVEGQQLKDGKDEALYYSSKDLFTMRNSVSGLTQSSVGDALARHHVNLPPEDTKYSVGQAVNHGWERSDYFLNQAEDTND